MKTMLISASFFALFSFTFIDGLIGRWETQRSPKGNITSVQFKDDQSFEVYINKKAFATGKYSFKDSLLSFTDNGCKGARGVYKVIFFHNGDSLRMLPVSDSCEERKNGMIRTVLGRVK